MRKMIAAIAAAALLLGTSPVLAGGKHHRGHDYGYGGHSYGYGGYKHGYRGGSRHGYRGGHSYKRRHHGDHGAYLLGGLAGGLIIGSLLTQNSYRQAPVYAAPPPRARYDCKPTTGTGYVNGYLATFGGTFCYDARGFGYVVPGSEYFIGYVQ